VISFIIPAHNEEALIGRTLVAIHQSAKEIGQAYEIIVVDDASTDRTVAIALEHQVCVVNVANRQIAATRNAGAKQAKGDPFIFVDADTQVTARVLRATLKALRGSAVGGGCLIHIDGPLPQYALVLERLLFTISPLIGLAGGCFFFCTREAYIRSGGFDETLYVSEEVTFARKLKQLGRFVILRDFVTTSGRKLRAHSALELLRVGLQIVMGGRQAIRRRDGLEYWYGRRQIDTWPISKILPK
jgi:glycosyltransferase involved in cell wall biosynthesis